LCEFDHQNYEVFFVLASESDPATSTVKRVVSQSRVKLTPLFAGRPEGRGEKVNNLIHAVSQLASGIRSPGVLWTLTGNQENPGCAAWSPHFTTRATARPPTMRWLIPNHNNFPTALLTAWNAPIVTMLGEKREQFFAGARNIHSQSGF